MIPICTILHCVCDKLQWCPAKEEDSDGVFESGGRKREVEVESKKNKKKVWEGMKRECTAQKQQQQKKEDTSSLPVQHRMYLCQKQSGDATLCQ